jgi:hypothetical protein
MAPLPWCGVARRMISATPGFFQSSLSVLLTTVI